MYLFWKMLQFLQLRKADLSWALQWYIRQIIYYALMCFVLNSHKYKFFNWLTNFKIKKIYKWWVKKIQMFIWHSDPFVHLMQHVTFQILLMYSDQDHWRVKWITLYHGICQWVGSINQHVNILSPKLTCWKQGNGQAWGFERLWQRPNCDG